jgi:hypothetical protein
VTIDTLLKKWVGKELAGERAEYQQFLTELMQALDVPTPGDGGVAVEDYRFEAPVRSEAVYGGKGTKRIDLYKRGSFILEAKQSREDPGAPSAPTPDEPAETLYDLFGTPIGVAPAKGAPRRRYDKLMEDARIQAQRYALALPENHPTPPFLIVADVGRSFELYFDWSGSGRGYRPFPDERGYRIVLADLASEATIAGVERSAADTLRAIWTDPASIDPRTRAAKVTRDIATLLSRVATQLEEGEQKERKANAVGLSTRIEETSAFLMRTLFCMFAEDVGLLPKDSFKTFLADAEGRSDQFWRRGLEDLWGRMNDPQEVNRYWSQGDAVVRYFNGNLFSGARVFDLPPEAKNILRIAADQDWRAVEPAIFGTLLEQVLTTADRAKLGAHYTPRACVERLVQATVMDVLTPEWEAARDAARVHADAGEPAEAIALACAFHARLRDVRVLDPACGTGNFLYVAMEALLRLESEVRQFVVALGGTLDPAIHPNQFLGLELNPRAAVIAELVLWIGLLRFRLANTPEAIGEPVLPPLVNINGGAHGGYDAVLARTATGEPDTEHPRRPDWPEADFIVGNPPFIGGKDVRDRLGSAYAEALWAANPHVPKSADFVMQWWDHAAEILTRPEARLRRFGFVTTNSITQVFSRRVIERWLALPPSSEGEAVDGDKLHLVLAIGDHPWTRVTKDAAAVRIAMTVAERGPGEGRLIAIVREAALDTDEPELDEAETVGRINPDLSVGTDVTQVVALKANEGLCSPGVKLHGAGFIVTPAKARDLGLGQRPGLEAHIREYRNGRDLLQRPRGVMVIDLFGLSEQEVMDRFPEVYQHLLTTVKVERDQNRRDSYRRKWWIFGEPRREMRPAARELKRYLGTTETSKHRIFQFMEATTTPDNMIVAIASDDLFNFGVLSSRTHTDWVLDRDGWLGFGNDNRYSKSLVFDPFPFPDRSEAVAAIAERLDTTRRTALAESPALTMTGLYNFVAAIREGTLPPEQEAAATRARLHRRQAARRSRSGGGRCLWLGRGMAARAVAAGGDRPPARSAQCRACGRRGTGAGPLVAPRLPARAVRRIAPPRNFPLARHRILSYRRPFTSGRAVSSGLSRMGTPRSTNRFLMRRGPSAGGGAL